MSGIPDTLGPIDYVLIEFPADARTFSSDVVDQVAALIDAGTIRLIDAIILSKDDFGVVQALELSEMENPNGLDTLAEDLATFLAEADLATFSEVMEPGTVAGVLIYECVWAAAFAVAARAAGGRLISDGRIHSQDIAAAREAEADLEGYGA